MKKNQKRICCGCAIGNSILKTEASARKMEQPREGPFNIVCAHANGTLTMQKSPVEERLNMQQVMPHVEQTNSNC
jgi:hypothetical protein